MWKVTVKMFFNRLNNKIISVDFDLRKRNCLRMREKDLHHNCALVDSVCGGGKQRESERKTETERGKLHKCFTTELDLPPSVISIICK